MAEVYIKNLGSIKEAYIKTGKLTVFAGENNSGKTYLNYLLYAYLDQRFRFKNKVFYEIAKSGREQGTYKFDILSFLDEHFKRLKNDMEKSFQKSLDSFYSADDGTFKEFSIELKVNVEEIKDNLYKKRLNHEMNVGKKSYTLCEINKEEDSADVHIVFHEPDAPIEVYADFINDTFVKEIFYDMHRDTFLLPAERTGINLFFHELNDKRNALINHLQKANIDPIDVIKDLIVSKYPQPIADYIQFLNNLTTLKKRKSEYSYLNKYLHHEIIQGKYGVDKNGNIAFEPYQRKFKGNIFKDKIDLHLSSSTVKTFFSLEFYIEHIAKDGSVLIIDEPELNLHPDNQRRIARLLARLVNAGVDVVISTHSDYIIREFNNLIMLSRNFSSRDSLLEKYKYDKSELIGPEKVKVYIVNDGKVESAEMDDEGIIMDTFDDIINQMNQSSNEIYITMIEEIDQENGR